MSGLSLIGLNPECALSAREIQIAILIYKRYSRQLISEKLFISINTVKTHVASIYAKCLVDSKNGFLDKLRNYLEQAESRN